MGKTMQVDRSRYDALRGKSEEAKRKRRRSEEELEMARRRMQESLADMERMSRLDTRQFREALQEEDRRMRLSLEEVETEIRREIYKENENLQREINSLRKAVDGTNVEIDRVNRRIGEIAEEFDRRLGEILARMDGERSRAGVYVYQLEELVSQIDPLYPEKLTPGEAEPLRDALEFAYSDMDNGDFQAAIGVAQEHIVRAAELLARLKGLNDEFNRLGLRISEAVVQIRGLICGLSDNAANEQDVSITVGDDMFEFCYDGDVEHWSEGLYMELCRKFDSLERRVKEEYIPDMDLAHMREALGEINVFGGGFERCGCFAREEFLASCHVQGTAARIHEAVTKNSTWELADSGFENGDDRRSYLLSYTDRKGNCVTVVIFSEDGNIAAGSSRDAGFSVDASDGSGTEHTGMSRVIRDDVVSRIQKSGIDMGGVSFSKPGDRTGRKAEVFLDEEYKRGTGIKNRRINTARMQMNLHGM